MIVLTSLDNWLQPAERDSPALSLALAFPLLAPPLYDYTKSCGLFIWLKPFFFLADFTTYASANTREKQLQSMWIGRKVVPFRPEHSWISLNR